jgi:leucyl-tRNA synthetase
VLEVFTTRPDTVFGATFMVVAPEHPVVAKITSPDQRQAVEQYQFQASRQTEIDRLATDKEKTGVFTGGYVINPLTKQRIPIWIADYVLMSYGTGAIMAVPAGDARDWEFAKKFGLPIVTVVEPLGGFPEGEQTRVYTGPGRMVNSGRFNGLKTLGKYGRAGWNEALAKEHGVEIAADEPEGVEEIIKSLEAEGIGQAAVTYRLRDWLISRQRYWGTPIPMVYCEQCGIVPVPEDQLPVRLPEDVDFRPTGESPLRFHESFLHTTCPTCGGPAKRETDTMDTFVDSSWYWFRYLSPKYTEGPFDPARQAWVPVDQYTGGAEHAVMHLLYARFWTKVMYDMGLIGHDEPFQRLFNQGVILGPNGQKMSKSRGNVVDPDALVAEYGADVVRTYLMFIGPWNQGGPWNHEGIEGLVGFMRRVWDLVVATPQGGNGSEPSQEQVAAIRRRTHQTIAAVSEDYQQFSFNTMLAELMKFTNDLRDFRQTPVVNSWAWKEALDTLVLLLAPAAPHIAEELWVRLGNQYSVHQQRWPTWDAEIAREESFELVVQVNGKVRDRIQVPAGISEAEARQLALASEPVSKFLEGRQPRKVIFVPGRLINLVG